MPVRTAPNPLIRSPRRQPIGRSRRYYFNPKTGLIDRATTQKDQLSVVSTFSGALERIREMMQPIILRAEAAGEVRNAE